MKKIFVFFILLTLNVHYIFSQRLEVGLFAGGTSFTGDIEVNYKTFLQQIKFGAGGFVKYHLSENFVARAQFTSGTFGADEKKHPVSDYTASRGYSFKSKISDITAVMEWHPFGFTPEFGLTNSNMYISIYGFTGLGETFFNPTANLNQQTYRVTNGTTDFAKNALIIPVGAGLRWHLTEEFTLNAEVSGRKVFSDYSDGLKLNPNSKHYKDYYFFGGLSISYLFNSNRFKSRSNKLYSNVNYSGVSCPRFK